VRNERVEVLEEGDSVSFLHRVVPGGADRSYGIHVAAVAGLPAGVIARARQVLGELEQQRPLEPPEFQMGLPIEMAADPLRKELEEIDPASLSPLEALQKLYQLRAKLS
jgi:DNA mismatch repair protein MutS